MSRLTRIAAPLPRAVRLAAMAIVIYFASWVCWCAIVWLGFGWFVQWARIRPDVAWERDPTYMQRLLALPPLIPVILWLAFAVSRRRQESGPPDESR